MNQHEPLDGSRYSAEIAIDTQHAPITSSLAMRFQAMDADIAAAPLGERNSVALNEMYAFLGHLITVVHQLETGTTPPIVSLPE